MHDRLGPVRYRTPNPQPMVAFYQGVLGFTLRSQSDLHVHLGTSDRDLVILDIVPGARKVAKTTGLYHTAFLVPQHRDLVHLLGRIATAQTPVEGFNHHGTHEAIYLPDPDGNGVELAWDLPQPQWPLKESGEVDFLRHDHVFDPQAVLAEFQADAQPWPGLPVESRVGHVHLHMGHFEPTKSFYTELMGLKVMFSWEKKGAMFLALDGYHHHVGANLWKGVGLPPAPDDAIGLVEYTWKADADQIPDLRLKLEARGYPTHDKEKGFFVKDNSGIGIAVIGV